MNKFFMLALVILFSCGDDRRPEIIDTTEKDSYTSSQDLAVGLEGGFKYKSHEWKEVNRLLEQQSIKEPERFKNPGFTFRSVIYFSEKGDIYKIILLEGINDEIDNTVFRFIQKTFKGIPPEINNKAIKSHIDFIFTYSPNGLSFFPSIDNFLLPEAAPEDMYLVSVDEMPSPIGGMENIAARLKYPDEAKKQGIEGKVIIKLLIDEFGNPQNSRVIKGVHPLLDAEARDVLMKTKFLPGKNEGKPVKVQVTVPISFKLK